MGLRHMFGAAHESLITRSICAASLLAVLSAVSHAAYPRRVCFKDVCVNVEVADTEQARQTGLMFRDRLAENSGMLFTFERAGIYSFWMKNTLIPLDMIWLDQDRAVVSIKTHVPPCTSSNCPSITPEHEALFVLEVNAGFVDAHRIALGDTARFADE